MRKVDDLFEEKPRGRGLFTLFIFVLIVAVLLFINSLNNRRVEVCLQSVTVSGLDKRLEKFRILHISDLCGRYFGTNQAALAQALKDQSFQVVCITGDVCKADGDYGAFLALIDLFVQQVPVFFVAGDQDPQPLTLQARDGQVKADWVLAAEAHGAVYLDSPQPVNMGGATVWFCPESIYGLDIDSTRSAYEARQRELAASDAPSAASQRRMVEYGLQNLDRIQSALQMMGEHAVQVAVGHIPLTETTLRTLQQWAGTSGDSFFRGVSLILSGHYNAGQYRIPLWRAVKAPASAGGGWFPDDAGLAGLSTVLGVSQYISPGLGTSSEYPLPLRIFNRPAVSVLTLTATYTW